VEPAVQILVDQEEAGVGMTVPVYQILVDVETLLQLVLLKVILVDVMALNLQANKIVLGAEEPEQ
jgi:hypothetical protein